MAENFKRISLEINTAKIYVNPSPDNYVHVKWKRKEGKPKPMINVNEHMKILTFRLQEESFLNFVHNKRYSP